MYRKFEWFLLCVLALLFIVGCSSLGDPADTAAFAASADPLEDLTSAATALAGMLIGIPAVLASILTLLEYYGKIDTALADKIQLYTNTGLYLLALGAVLTGQTPLLPLLDHYLTGINSILVAIIGILIGGVYSVIQTASFQGKLRKLAPVQQAAHARIAERYHAEG